MNFRSLIQPVLVAVALLSLVAFAASPMLPAPVHDDTHILVPDAATAPVQQVPVSQSPFTRGLIWAFVAGAALFGMANFPSMDQAATILKQNNWDINALMGDWVDRGPWVYYDTLYVISTGALASQYSPFQIKMGQPDSITGVAKTKLQTNMIENGSFGATRCLILMELGLNFPSFIPKAAVDLVLNSMYLEVRIAEKIFWEGIPEIYPSGTGLSGVTSQTGEETWTIGLPSQVYARTYQKYAKYIAPLIPMTWTLNFIGANGAAPTLTLPNPGVGVQVVNGASTYLPFLKVFMGGLTDRAVQ